MSGEWTSHDALDAYGESEFGWYDYDPLIASLGTVLLKVEDNDYQGDTRVLLADGDRRGFVVIGWGSCSGCDALQGSRNLNELAGLRNSIANDVHWEDSAEAMARWLLARDWEVDFSWRAEETQRFVVEALRLLGLPAAGDKAEANAEASQRGPA